MFFLKRMKKKLIIVALISFVRLSLFAQDSRLISDCTVFFDVSVEGSKVDPRVVKSMAGTTKVLYIKGSKSRSDLITPGFQQTTFTDSKSDSTIILRELGNTKYISYLSDNKRNEQNKKYEGIQFTNTGEKKTILGYECVKAVSKLTNGSAYNVFYTPALIPSNKQYEYQFRDLQGLVLEYEEESEDVKTTIKYSATKITLDPVPEGKFNLPKSGYRIL